MNLGGGGGGRGGGGEGSSLRDLPNHALLEGDRQVWLGVCLDHVEVRLTGSKSILGELPPSSWLRIAPRPADGPPLLLLLEGVVWMLLLQLLLVAGWVFVRHRVQGTARLLQHLVRC